jgi:ABC-type bacteriocin/lantibiotic exporter with double-glycine peptidase domain
LITAIVAHHALTKKPEAQGLVHRAKNKVQEFLHLTISFLYIKMKFPYYKQLDSTDCCPSCLRMVAKYYGKTYTVQTLRSKSFITRSGVSMLGISDAAENIGFRTRGYRLTWEQLRDEVPLPCIVHWNQRHFEVVYSIKKRRRLFKAKGSELRAQDETKSTE